MEQEESDKEAQLCCESAWDMNGSDWISQQRRRHELLHVVALCLRLLMISF